MIKSISMFFSQNIHSLSVWTYDGTIADDCLWLALSTSLNSTIHKTLMILDASCKCGLMQFPSKLKCSKTLQTSPNHPNARLPSTFHHFTVPWFPRSKASTFWHQVPMEEQQELQRRATALQEHLEAAEPETPVHLCVSWSSYVMVIPHENRDIHDTQCVWNPWWWEDVRGPYDINLMF